MIFTKTSVMQRQLFSMALAVAALTLLICCNSSADNKTQESGAATTPDNSAGKTDANAEKTGVGKFQHVELTHPLDDKMVAAGKGVYDLKCASCHKLTDEKLVGPGWKGVTDRRTPEWIMNFVTNTDEMIEKNQQAKNLYEVCLVKMPNQNLSDADARAVLEFQRNNDGKK
jgi:cytochrome c551/c552